jgi:hypothetical protein
MDNPTPIILAVYGDLLKAKERTLTALKKLEVRIRVLHTADNPDFILIEKLVIDMEKKQNALVDLNHELELFERKLNGGASLDKFLDTGKAKVEE